MVWAAIARDFKLPLFWVRLTPRHMERGQWVRAEGLNGQRYADQIIRGPLAQAMETFRDREGPYLSLEDNAPAHNAAIANRAREDLGIGRLDHPSSSPDLNPIENIYNKPSKNQRYRSGLSQIQASKHDLQGDQMSRAGDVASMEMPIESLPPSSFSDGVDIISAPDRDHGYSCTSSTEGSVADDTKSDGARNPVENSGSAGKVLIPNPEIDWVSVTSQTLGAANTASSVGFTMASGMAAFGLNLAKRITQGLVSIPAIAIDGALMGTAPGYGGAEPSAAKLANAAVGGFFDAISFIALGSIQLTGAVTGAGLGAAGSGVEALRRALGSEVLRSLSEFTRLVKREWNASDDSLPPGGIPKYSAIAITQALTMWVCIQMVTRVYYEKRMLSELEQIDLKTFTMASPSDRGQQDARAADPIGNQQHPRENPAVGITSEEVLSSHADIIGAKIGSPGQTDSSSGASQGTVSKQERIQSLDGAPVNQTSTREALRGLRRYSKLVLGAYGGFAMSWLGAMPKFGKARNSEARKANANPSDIISSSFEAPGEDELRRKDEDDFIMAAKEMDSPTPLKDEGVARGMPGSFNQLDGTDSFPNAENPCDTASQSPHLGSKKSFSDDSEEHTTYSFLDLFAGRHDEELFHRTASLDPGTAQAGSYDENLTPLAADGAPARPSRPRYYVVTDHVQGKIILVLRGTLSLGDLGADLTCESVVFAHSTIGSEFQPRTQAGLNSSPSLQKGEPDLVHEGMYLTAKEIGDVGRPVHRAVKRALESNAGYGLEITGHSLGAGVAALLALLWASPMTCLTRTSSGFPEGRRVHAFCFAVPCVMSSGLSKSCRELITSYTHSYDLVCRLSLGAVRDLRNAVAWLCYEDSEGAKRVGSSAAQNIKMTKLMKKAFEHQAGRLGEGEGISTEGSEETETKAGVERDFLIIRKTLEANMTSAHLFPPGNIFCSFSPGDLSTESNFEKGENSTIRLFKLKQDANLAHVFGQIIFSKSMLSCHMPNVYDQSLHSLPEI
ncbi:hypothetical protein IE53DRAFT_371080 [Violaceomyces palustris]|uniref:Uncharacterized protein n=1 Tax=Violaceomyces palustris TaxID=1673888 RepID=A0ACD0NQ16_9BASI|nr:hypothetical protein IE53DRAFT_371080 [Violaceomyces palustris]